MKSKGIVPPETLELLGPDFVGDVGRFVYPIFRDREGAPESIGSGFLVRFDDGLVCLITAAHVLDHIRRGEDLYWYAGTALKRHVEGQGLLSPMPPGGNRDDDRIDVGVVILNGEGLPPYADIGKDALPAERLHMGAVPRTDKKYAVLGFPASKASVHRPDKYVLSASYSYLASSIPPNDYAPLGIAEQSHIAIHFDKKRVNHPDGRKMNFPKPAGISGSPLWELRRPDEGGPRVVGVMIENKQSGRAMVATDIGYALMMLADHFIKLGKERSEGSHERQANQASPG